MIPLILIKRVLVFFLPLILFHLLRKTAKEPHLPKGISHVSNIDKSLIVEGEIVEDKIGKL